MLFSDITSSITMDVQQYQDFLNGPVLSQESLDLSQTPKRKRYKLSTKIQLVRMMEENDIPVKNLSEVTKIHRRNLERWRSQKDDLKRAVEVKKIEIRKRSNLTRDKRRLAKYPQIEAIVYDRFRERRAQGLRVNGKWISDTAREEASKIGIDETVFKASKGWISRFLNRYDLSLRALTTVGQNDPEDAKEQALHFFDYFSRLRQRLTGYTLTYANMDEVPVWFDMPGSRTYDFEGNRSIKLLTTGNEKLRFTVVLCSLSTGEKVKPMIIFRTPKNIEFVDDSIYVTGSSKGSMTHELMEKWRKNCWRVRPNYQQENITGVRSKRRTVLILDSARCHLDPDLKQKMDEMNNTEIKIITGAMTKYLQPADIVYNKSFKDHMKDYWSQWMENGVIELTRTGRRRAAFRETVINWVKDAFAAIPPEMISSSYHRCGILDEDASNMLHHRLLNLITDEVSTDEQDAVERSGITDDEIDNDDE